MNTIRVHTITLRGLIWFNKSGESNLVTDITVGRRGGEKFYEATDVLRNKYLQGLSKDEVKRIIGAGGIETVK